MMRKLPWLLPLLLTTAAMAQRGGAVTNRYAPYVPTCVAAPPSLSCPTDGYVCVYSSTLYRCTAAGGWDSIVGSTSANLPADPTGCGAGDFVSDIAIDGTLTCTTPAGAGDMLAAVYDTNANNVVDTATALAANPAACGAGNYVTDIDANGTLTCGTPAGSGDMLKSSYDSDSDNLVNGAEDLTCTDCIGSTEISDEYLLNSGDVGTGVYDFGGATSIEIVNAASPTVDTTGEVGVDTTEDNFLYMGSSTLRVLSYINYFSFTLETPADADNFLVFRAPFDITVSSINCIVDPADSAESVVIDVQERNTTGDSPATVDATITCDNDGAADDGSLTNPTITVGEWVSIDIGTVTGTVTQVVVTVAYTVTRK